MTYVLQNAANNICYLLNSVLEMIFQCSNILNQSELLIRIAKIQKPSLPSGFLVFSWSAIPNIQLLQNYYRGSLAIFQ